MRFHLVGDFVAFQDVREGVHLETEGIGYVHQHVDLALHIGMTGNKTLAVEDLGQRVQFQVAAGAGFRSAASITLCPGVHGLVVFLCARVK